jgi:alpha 1,6-mannosyltransferase
MYLSEKEDSFSPLRQILHHVSSQRRIRNYAAAGIALILLSMVWLSGNLTGSNSSQRWRDEVANKRVPVSSTKITGTNHTHLVSPNIWQIVLPKTQPYPGDAEHVHIDPRQIEHAASWIATNPGYQ